MPRLPSKYCTYAAACKQLKRWSKVGKWHTTVACQCSVHIGTELTIYLFDKLLANNPIYRAYKKGQEPKGLTLGLKGYYIMGHTIEPIHLLTPSGPTFCGLLPGTPAYATCRKTVQPRKYSCPKCREVVASSCYCVCHSPVSSCPWCEHCKGDNMVMRARMAGKTADTLKGIFTDAASDVADEFYPKGNPRRGEFIRDAAVLYTKLEPVLLQLIAKRDLMSTHRIIEDIHNGNDTKAAQSMGQLPGAPTHG